MWPVGCRAQKQRKDHPMPAKNRESRTEQSSLNGKADQLVINYHITEVCNYQCTYCYAKYDHNTVGRELLHDKHAVEELLKQLHAFFSPQNVENPLRLSFPYKSVRLNLAGGEPLLYPKEVLAILASARQLNFEASIITNGSRFTPNLIAELVPQLSVLGISIDSLNDVTNKAIGRVDKRLVTFSKSEYAEIITAARQAHPGIIIKINTVVNSLNCCEKISDLIFDLGADKWKIFLMLPSINGDLQISNEHFNTFVNRNKIRGLNISVEDNADMTDSYIMIDPHGRFYQTSIGQVGHTYSRPILSVGAKAAFSEINFSVEKFQSRYPSKSGEN
jgi:radical S-adenosyl methionine domain-containing protein 2